MSQSSVKPDEEVGRCGAHLKAFLSAVPRLLHRDSQWHAETATGIQRQPLATSLATSIVKTALPSPLD